MKLRVRESRRKFILQPRHFRQADRIDRNHAHCALDQAFQIFELNLKLFFAAEQVAAEVVEQLAGGRQCHGPRGAIKQRYAETTLELLDILAGSRLADLVHSGATADAFHLSYVTEKLEAVQEHASILS